MMYVPDEMELKRMCRNIEETYTRKFLYTNNAKHDEVGKRPLSKQQKKIYNLARVGWQPAAIAKRTGLPLASVYDGLHKITFNGWKL